MKWQRVDDDRAVGGARSEQTVSAGLFDDLPALVGVLLHDVLSTCDSCEVDPVGALTVRMMSDVLTSERAYRWQLDLSDPG